jgi:hypothetical protein
MKAPNMADGDDDPLAEEYERNTLFEHISAGVLVVGLAAELVNAAIWFEGVKTIAEMCAVSLIVLGVAGEVWFGNRARIAGDKQMAEYRARLAEANARAEEANQKAQEAALELERLKTPRTISPEQGTQIVEAIRPFTGTPFDFSLSPDPEPLALMNQLADFLTEAGWDWRPVRQLITFNRPGKPNVAMHTGEGVHVLVASSRKAEWEPAILALANALITIGLERVVAHEADDGSADDEAIHIRIGIKP